MPNLFDRARTVTAREVAEREGIQLHQQGTRWWACCPLHGERTASLMFDDDGGWHCFGCGAGGADGTSILAALRGIRQGEAARLLAGQGYEPEQGAEIHGSVLHRTQNGHHYG